MARSAGTAILALLTLTIPFHAACSSGPNRPREVDVIVRDVPSPLRGTIGSMTRLVGVDPVFVTGYGLVVDLPGTGDTSVDATIAAAMAQRLSLMGITSDSDFLRGTRYQGMTPAEIIRDPSTAVVQVVGAIPPGLPDRSVFDVGVYPAPGSTATSLENGYLWPMDLDLMPTIEYTGKKTRTVGTAEGPVLVNAFAQGDDSGEINRRFGRILNGGLVTQSQPIQVFLDNPSYEMARAMVSAINTRFPMGYGDRGPAARGRDRNGLTLTVPTRYLHAPEDFVLLVQHLQVDPFFPEEHARRYVQAVQEYPGLAVNLSWCLEALGEPAIPFARQLYDHPQAIPRMAGLRAGARLGDALAAEGLIQLAKEPRATFRMEAIDLLADIDRFSNYPMRQVDMTLIELAGDEELLVRVAAGEALVDRAQRDRFRSQLASEMSHASREEVQAILTSGRRVPMPFSRDPARGVARESVAEKFVVDHVPYGRPLIYVAQQGSPRIMVFGEEVRLPPSVFASLWGDRLLVRTDEAADAVYVYYRFDDPRVAALGSAPTMPSSVVAHAPNRLMDVLRLMATTPTERDPRPTLNFTYSQVIGALAGLHDAGVLPAEFSTETDRLNAEVFRAMQASGDIDRPETAAARDERWNNLFTPDGRLKDDAVPTPMELKQERSLIVPLNPGRPGGDG